MADLAQVRHCIQTCQDSSRPWLADFLIHALGHPERLHWWPGANDYHKIKSGHIVVLNEEGTLGKSTAELMAEMNLPDNVICITSIPARYQQLLEYTHIKPICFPHEYWFADILGIRKTNTVIGKKLAGDRIFNFLNTTWIPGRFYLIEYIFKNYPELLDTGYITATEFSYYKHHPKIQTDQLYKDWFMTGHDPMENTCVDLASDIAVQKTTKNLLHIAKNIPGRISIQVESYTPAPASWAGVILAEKSMQALATAQIPIVIGNEPNWLTTFLKNEGFDIFDDIIDQSYDSEPDYYKRLELAIDLNIDWLTGRRPLPDLESRLLRNQTLLFNEWCDHTLADLIDKINQFSI